MKIVVPCWLYHPYKEPRIFRTPEEVKKAIEEGWVDSPAKTAEAKEIKKQKEKEKRIKKMQEKAKKKK